MGENLVYSAPGCMKCVMIKNAFNDAGIEFKDENIMDMGEEDRQRIVDSANGDMSLPIIKFSDGTWMGGSMFGQMRAKIEELK